MNVLDGVANARAASGGTTPPAIDDVLAEPFHLSFPRVYREQASTWLVPEMADAGQQLAYPMDGDATKIVGAGQAIDGLANIVDPILFQHDGGWWAFASPSDRRSGDHLNLYYADHFLGPYTAHPENPVRVDPYGARSAGPVVQRSGQRYRFGQVFGQRYGEGVDVFAITTIDRHVYRERRVGTLRRGDGAPGMHSVDFIGHRLVVDGYTMHFSALAGVQRVLMKFHSA